MGDVDRIRQAQSYGQAERYARQPVQRAGDQSNKRQQHTPNEQPAVVRDEEPEMEEVWLPEHAVVAEPGHIDIKA
ncbi:MAG: hypothetical protein JNM04_00975 [Chthonomonas sp.]|nr:hypothetical protein [Chthonomonas sp.]